LIEEDAFMRRKYGYRIGIIISIICLLLYGLSSCKRYPSGKNTVLLVGDGRFQVLHGISHKDILFKKRYFLVDAENYSLYIEVQKYYLDKKGRVFYLISEDGYILINYEAGYYEKHDEIIDYEEKYQVIFQDEDKFITFGQH